MPPPDHPHGHSAFFLVGPTAVGKSAVAQRLAETAGREILSADSMLVYRGMDIGTDKPRAGERAKVRYWGVDILGPDEDSSVGRYLEHAAVAFREIAAAGREVVVVGGTGLYVKCLTEGLADLPAAHPETRARAEQMLASHGLGALQAELKARDPARYEALQDKLNPRRLIRALELAVHGAKAGRSWEGGRPGPLAGLRMAPAALHERIRQRVERMFGEGLVEEARCLRETHRQLSPTALQAIGYSEAFDVLDGKCGLAAAIGRTVKRTNALAKRQMTWFKGQANVEWVDVDADADAAEVAARVEKVWKEHGSTGVSV